MTWTTNVAEAISAAREASYNAATYRGAEPLAEAVLAERRVRDKIDRLSTFAPGAGTSQGLLAAVGVAAVPIDPGTLEPSGPPLTTFEAVLAHYAVRPDDGAGVALGALPGGRRLVAVKATLAAWLDWAKEHLVTRSESPHPDYEDRTIRAESTQDWGSPIRVLWSSPAPASTLTTAAFGGRSAATFGGIASRLAGVAAGRAPAERAGWNVWTLPEGATLKGRKLGHGCTLLTEGVVPWFHVGADGWRLMATSVPGITDEMPPWLCEKFGGRLR